MDVELARQKMVQQQVRTYEVLDPAVLDALSAVPRERFVPAAFRAFAFAEIEVPLAHGEAMMTPRIEGRALQALALTPRDRVLEIGTGSGFLTACLAQLAAQVESWELHPDLAAAAAECLAAMGSSNARVAHRDGHRLPDDLAPFDAICLTGSVRALEPSFLAALAPGGRLFAVVGEGPTMTACLYTRRGERSGCSVATLFETVLPPLRNQAPVGRFQP